MAQDRFITVYSTTSAQDSGLFEYLLPIFQSASGLKVDVAAVGTGEALALGRRGFADALFVHDRPAEDKFISDGYGVDRRDVMYDDFVIVGPSHDPARIRGLKDVKMALARIAAARVPFASRGDDSGTARMEIRLWELADKIELRLWKSWGVEPDHHGAGWYRPVGQGMGVTLNICAAMDAYTLTDRATWVNFKNRRALAILTEGDPRLFNPYSSILVNPAKWPLAKYNDARIWHQWLTSKAGLDAITSYKINGEQLFFPLRGEPISNESSPSLDFGGTDSSRAFH
jgi:tungstate transport system substrate-binding protein